MASTETEQYYEMHQRETERFKKYPNGKAKEDGFTPKQNHRMYMTALAQQSMVRDLVSAERPNYGEIKRHGHIRKFM